MARTLANSNTKASPLQAPASAFGRGAIQLFNMLQGWGQRQRARRQLYQMPDYILSDIGVSRSDVTSEYEKPFWRE